MNRGVASVASKAFALVLLLACCTLLTACPPEGGDLVPLARGDGDEASVVTTKFDGDTLAVERDSLTMLARGRWSVADAATSVILEAINANERAVTIDFSRGEMSRDDGSRLTLRSVSREKASGGVDFLPDKTARIEGGRRATFTLEFASDAAEGSSAVSKDLLGRTATLRIPVALQTGTTVDFVFGFKYAERRAR